jgi:6-phosphogluconolactonase
MCALSMIARLPLYITIVCSIVGATHAQAPATNGRGAKTRVYISTCTEHGSDGIYLAELDPKAGELQLVRQVAAVKKASFIAIHPSREFLYSTCEVDGYQKSKGGAVSAFKIDALTGNVTLLNHQSSAGEGPHHLSLDVSGKYALVANYFGGSVAVLPIGIDGTLAPASSMVLHHGSSVNTSRQSSPHPHAINVDPTNRFAFVPDLGLDKVLAYRFDGATGTLTPANLGPLSTPRGSGPRHIAFHSSGKWAYVINELDSTVLALGYDAKAGTITKLETVSTLPAGGFDGNITGEIVVHPNGEFLYASNRGHDSIAAFEINQQGRLKLIGHCAAGGRTPRNFNIDHSGRFLLSANLDSDSVTVLRIDPSSGKLSRTAQGIKVPQPYCIDFVPN